MRPLFVFALCLTSCAPALIVAPDSPDGDKANSGETTVVPTNDAWTLFRGNALQSGVSPGRLPDKLVELWKFEAKDAIEGAPAVHRGVVYVGSNDEYLYAIDLATGKEKWKYKGASFTVSPAYRDGAIYVGDGDGIFHCVDAAGGKKKWTFKTDGEIKSAANFSGDLILFGSYDESLYCLTKDGKEKWTFKTAGPVNGSPAVAEGKTFVAGCDSSIHIIDIAKGTELSAVELTGQAAATAAVHGDHLYVGNMSNDLQAVDLKKAAVAWTFTPDKFPQAFFSSAAVTDEYVVVGCRNKRLYIIDRKTGKEKKPFLTGGRVDSSPVVVGDCVYVGSDDGNLYVIDLKTGGQVQKIELDGPVTGSAAVAAGRLLIGTKQGTLYCFGEKK
jgi:outer membrane protein assembly factor BamB